MPFLFPAILHCFTYMPPTTAQSVSLVGSFNQWDKSANPMEYKNGRWTVTVDLPPGLSSYKFVVNGNEFVTDPDAPATGEDGFGGKNGLLRLEAEQPKTPPRPVGQLEPSLVRHRLQMPDRDRLDARTVSLRLATRPGDLKKAMLLVERNGHWWPRAMQHFASTPAGDYYRASLQPGGGALHYGFLLEDRQGAHFFGPHGLSPKAQAPFVWNWQAAPAFETPQWAKGRIFYQIFPERFADGDPGNDPPHSEKWGGKPTNWNFFGGDLLGVRQHLGYLSKLGIEGLYFNPVFESSSNHKYNTTDYTRIDPHFGSNAEFARLSEAAHQLGMRVMLDGVFNHTGTAFAAFQEAIAKGPASPAWNWYTFNGFPVTQEPKPNYKAWWGFASLPQLNNANPEVRDYLLGIGKRWMAPGLADAWRLDVPNEVPRPFWADFRQAVHAVRPDALIVGEIWGDGSPWLAGDNFDSVMNYRFRSAVLDFLAYDKLDAHGFGDALDQIRADYGDQVEDVLFNLIDSHDTERFLHAAHEDKARLRLAALLQMTYPGMPVVYYGDEVGMTGGPDPDNRRTMVWDPAQQDHSLLADYTAMIALRRMHPALKHGTYERLETKNPGVFAFRRTSGAEHLLVVLNKSDKPFPLGKIPAYKGGKALYPALGEQSVPEMSGYVLKEL